MYTVYGIPNCNTVKKALDWLNANKIAYEFHDYKKKGITAPKLKAWSKQTGWEKLVNKKATWNQLDEAVKASITNEAAAIELLIEKPSIIKRPLIEKDGKVVALGFDEAEYASGIISK
jgi:Spx/MgsR family transcriptional regulator